MWCRMLLSMWITLFYEHFPLAQFFYRFISKSILFTLSTGRISQLSQLNIHCSISAKHSLLPKSKPYTFCSEDRHVTWYRLPLHPAAGRRSPWPSKSSGSLGTKLVEFLLLGQLIVGRFLVHLRPPRSNVSGKDGSLRRDGRQLWRHLFPCLHQDGSKVWAVVTQWPRQFWVCLWRLSQFWWWVTYVLLIGVCKMFTCVVLNQCAERTEVVKIFALTSSLFTVFFHSLLQLPTALIKTGW